MATISSSPAMPPASHRLHGLPSSALPAMISVRSARSPSAISSSGGAKRPWWLSIFRSTFREGAKSIGTAVVVEEEEEEKAQHAADTEAAAIARRSRLTTEKARVLRKEMRATEVWHDAMYHSAIASRLASPDQ